MKKTLSIKLLPLAVLLAISSSSAQSANWLMLQGTEKPNAPTTKLWGFIQVDYQQTDDTKLKAGPYKGQSAAFNQMVPQQSTSSGFNVKRARIGVRGSNVAGDDKINYFLLTEFGNNGMTTGKGGSQGQLTDASITLNHIPGARVRVGLFKTPGAEEAGQAIGTMNYVNFSTVTDRLLMERHFSNATGETSRSAPAASFRDIGVQVFDTFNLSGWDTSYAVMYGNGNGLLLDNDTNKDLYLYASTEKKLTKKGGPRAKSLKLFAWNQTGKRTLDDVGEKDRSRTGVGTTFWNGKFRFAAEYMQADGMIFGGTKGAGLSSDGATINILTDQTADGYYLDFGYRAMKNLELNVRYDYLDSGNKKDAKTGTNKDVQREFTTTTIGAQYFLNKKTTLTMNYEIRGITAPGAPSAAPVHKIVDSIDNRLALQLRLIF